MKARRMLRESCEALREGYGFATQRDDCERFELKKGLEVAKEHLLVESSSSWNREQFQTILSEAIAEREDISAIVFPRVDRFARNLEAAGYYLGMLRQNGLVLYFAQEELVVDSEASTMQLLMFFIHSFKADQDGKQMKHNLLNGRDKLAREDGQVPNGTPIWPFDYFSKKVYGQMTTGKPSLNQERAEWVRKWYEAITFNSMGVNAIEKWMVQEGVKTKRGNRISAKHIRDILTSRQILGEFRWKGKVYLKDENLRILTEEQFQTLQVRLRENKDRSYYNAVKYDYPPLPLVKHKCGQLMDRVPLQGRRGKVLYYRCRKCKGPGHTFKTQLIWDKLRPELQNGILREDRLIPALRAQYADNTATLASLENQLSQTDRAIADQEGKKDRAVQLGIELKGYPTEKVQAEIDKAEGKIQKLNLEKSELQRQLQIARQQTLDEEGIRRLCREVQGNLEGLDKDGWLKLNKRIGLVVTIHSKDDIFVKVSLPPVREVKNEFSQSLADNALDRVLTSIAL
jgi:DNA invertase Pin-like site-specific DNA recombinase